MKKALIKKLGQRGANLAEYLIILGVVAVAAIAAFATFGTTVRSKVANQTKTVQDKVSTDESGTGAH